MFQKSIAAAVFTAGLIAGSADAAIATTELGGFHGWGVHGGSVTVSGDVITGNHGDSEGGDPEFHWNKGGSGWSGRTGIKAFYSTSELNGRTVSDIMSIDYTVIDGDYSDVYFNIIVQDNEGRKAILAPSSFTATDSGFRRDGTADAFSVYEAEAGWNATATGASAASFNEVKDLVIAPGPFTEFPDTLDGAATGLNDAVYTQANWAAWADESAGGDFGWEQGGFLITFGQSTGSTPDSVTIQGLSVQVVPEPATVGLLLAAGLPVLLRRQRSA